MSNEIAIKVNNVTKSFKLPHEKHASVKSAFVSMFRRQSYEKQTVLKDVSFEIKKGEFYGIVGRNGNGKSTLLKMLAGIYEPSKGSVQTNGRLVPFIELGVGFNEELTGRENVYLNGSLLGFTRAEMDDMYDEIVAFAELEKFMDQKLKNYSSGMQVRLAFSVAIRAKTDILLIDEVLAVGDENFKRKCYDFFAQVKKQQKTVVFVSHDMDAVRDFCTSAVLINDGKIAKQGKPSDVINAYSKLNFEKTENDLGEEQQEQTTRWGDGAANIKKVWTSANGKKRSTFMPNDEIEINVQVEANQDLDDSVVGAIIQDSQGRVVFATNTKELNSPIKGIKEGQTIKAVFSVPNIFTNGSFTISAAVANFDRTQVYSRVENIHKLAITGWTMPHSLTHPKHKVKIT